MSNIEKYAKQIRDGEVIVGKYIRKLFCDILEPIVKGDDQSRYFDSDTFKRLMALSKHCKQSKGKYAQKPIEYMTFQKAILEALFGIYDRADDTPSFKVSLIEMGRKNGKSTFLVPSIPFNMMEENGAEVYVVATKLEQAKHLWEEVAMMRNKDNLIREILKKPVNSPIPTIRTSCNDSVFRAKALNPEKDDGLNASYVILDEVHQLPDEVFNVMEQSFGARDGFYRLVMITTQGTKREALLDHQLDYARKVLDGIIEDPHYLPVLYELDEDDDPYDEQNWYKANPTLGVVKSLQLMRDNARMAKENPTFELTFFCKDLNIVTKQSASWLNAKTIINPEVYSEEMLAELDNSVVIGGFDLSRTNDLTAFVTLLFDEKRNKLIAIPQFWIPSSFLETKEAHQAQVPWEAWIKAGYIRVAGTTTIDYHAIVEYVASMFKKHGWFYQRIQYDSYSANYIVEEFNSYGWSKDGCLIPTYQGFKTMSIPMQELKSILESKQLVYQNNPVLAWMLSNVELEEDRNGNWMPSKRNGNHANKIDGVSALLDCLVGYCENKESYLPHHE